VKGAHVVAVDVGTSSVKAALYDQRARSVAEVRHPYRPRLSADGTAEVEADALELLVARSLTQVLRTAGPTPAGTIVGVGVSTFWHGLLAADDSARSLTPVYLWADTRSAADSQRLRGRMDAEAVRQRTGCPIHASYWPAKLAWLRKERPDLWRRPVRWLSLGDLLFWRMFGRLSTSLSMASGTGLFLLKEQQWDGELLTALRVSHRSLSPVADEEFERGLVPRYRRRWPALGDVPWLLAMGDGALANFGSGCLTTTRRSLTVGTSGALRVMHAAADATVPQGLWRYRLDADRMITGGALSSGGNLRDWLLATLRLGRRQLEGRLRTMTPAAHGLAFLPHLAGERSPGYAAHAFGAVAGLTTSSTAEQIARAGLEAVAIEFAGINRRLDQVAPRPAHLVASGMALLSSPAWMQMMADAIGRPVAAGKAGEASMRGAALYVLSRLGLADSSKLDPGVGRTFVPRAAARKAFRLAQARQESLYRALIG
jgi:gluconokinase